MIRFKSIMQSDTNALGDALRCQLSRGMSGRVRKSNIYQHIPLAKKWFECMHCYRLMA